MKISIAVSILILVVGVFLGSHDRQQLAALRITQEQLIAKAVKLGISSDPAKLTSRIRPARVTIAKLSSAEVLELAKEIGRLDPTDLLNQKAIGTLGWRILDSLSAWELTELKTLLAEIHPHSDLNPYACGILRSSCTTVLAYDHPQAALGIFTTSPELLPDHSPMSLICTALATWARSDLTAAIEWLKKNPQPFSDYAESGIISAVAEQDPQHAFRLIGQLGLKDKNQTAWQIVNSAKTFEQKSATLAGLREYLPTIQTGNSLDHCGKSYLSMLAGDMRREGIEDITRWISESKLTPQELDPFLDGLANSTQGEESGRWIEWMRQSLPTKQAADRIENIIHQWAMRDHQAVSNWLSTTPDGTMKTTAVRSYAETISYYKPETAAQWALTLPPGKERDRTLKTIYQNWPKDDSAAKEAFAKEHGID